MPSGWCDDRKRSPYDSKREMRNRRSYRRRIRNANYKKDRIVLSEEG